MVKPLSDLPMATEICTRCGKVHQTHWGHPSCTAHRTTRDDLGNLRPCSGHRIKGLMVCRTHGGSNKKSGAKAEAAAKRKAAALAYESSLNKAVQLYGIPREVDPAIGLVEEYWRTAGIVDALEQLVRQLTIEETQYGIISESTEITQSAVIDEDTGKPFEAEKKVTTKRAPRPHVLVVQFERERDRFAKLGAEVVRLGLEARRDEYVRAQVDVFAGVLGQLDLSDEQRLQAAKLLRQIDQRPAIRVKAEVTR